MTQHGDAKREDVSRLVGGADYLTMPTTDTYVVGPCTREFLSGVTTLSAGQIVSLNSSSVWVLADANTASLYDGLLGVVVIGGATGAEVTVALRGSIVYLTAFSTLTVGTAYYLSETAGALTATKPTTGTSGQIRVGTAGHSDKLFVEFQGAAPVSGA